MKRTSVCIDGGSILTIQFEKVKYIIMLETKAHTLFITVRYIFFQDIISLVGFFIFISLTLYVLTFSHDTG